MMIIAADYSTMSQDTIHFVIHRVVGLQSAHTIACHRQRQVNEWRGNIPSILSQCRIGGDTPLFLKDKSSSLVSECQSAPFYK